SVLVASLVLAACDDKDAKKSDAKPQKTSSQIAKDLYDFAPAPPPPPPPPPAPIVFEDPAPLLRAERARELRALRQQAAKQYEAPAASGPAPTPLDVNWRLKDPDYQQRDPKAPEDRSTLPVDRYRVITAD